MVMNHARRVMCIVDPTLNQLRLFERRMFQQEILYKHNDSGYYVSVEYILNIWQWIIITKKMSCFRNGLVFRSNDG